MLTKPWVTSDLSFETSLALGYTGIFSGGSKENAATGIALDASTTHVFEATTLVKVPTQIQTDSGMLTADIHGGLEGRAIVNPELRGTLAGNSASFAPASTSLTAGLVAGGAMELALEGGASVFGGIDGTLRTDGSASASAKLGLKATF